MSKLVTILESVMPRDVAEYVVLPFLMISEEEVRANYARAIAPLSRRIIHFRLSCHYCYKFCPSSVMSRRDLRFQPWDPEYVSPWAFCKGCFKKHLISLKMLMSRFGGYSSLNPRLNLYEIKTRLGETTYWLNEDGTAKPVRSSRKSRKRRK